MESGSDWKWIFARAKGASKVFFGLAIPCLLVTSLWRWNDSLERTREACDQIITEATKELQARLTSLRERVSQGESISGEPRILTRMGFTREAQGWRLIDASVNSKALKHLDLSEREVLRMAQLPSPSTVDRRFWFERRKHDTFEIAHFGWKLSKKNAEEVTFVSMVADDWPFEKQTLSCRVSLSKSPVPSQFDNQGWMRTVLSRQTLPGLFYHAQFMTDFSAMQARNWFLSGLAMTLVLWLMTLALFLPRWKFEALKSQAFSKTVESFLEGDFKARPRLFLNDQDAPLESALGRLADRMPTIAWHVQSGRALGFTVDDLEDLEGHSIRRRWTIAHLEFQNPPVKDAVRSLESQLLGSGGVILSLHAWSVHPRWLTAWDSQSPEFAINAGNAILSALQLRQRLGSSNHFLAVFDIADVEVQSTPRKDFQITSPTCDEICALHPAPNASEVLITEDLYQHVRDFFVVTPSLRRTVSGRKLFLVENYVESESV